jgi:AcrR family transcriptional regulator
MDPRIAKTRLSLQEALFALASERGIDEVSVGDIAARAGVNRSTFYLHYSDKETLLADALDLVAQRSGARVDLIDARSPNPPQALVDFLVHVDELGDMYLRIFTEPGYGVVYARLRETLTDAIIRRAREIGARPVNAAPLEFIAAGVAGSILGVMGAWLRSDPRSDPAEAARWIWALVPRPAGRWGG